MKVDFHEEIKEPIYAFTIKNLQGIEITGTNTMYEKADVKGKKRARVRRSPSRRNWICRAENI